MDWDREKPTPAINTNLQIKIYSWTSCIQWKYKETKRTEFYFFNYQKNTELDIRTESIPWPKAMPVHIPW